MIFVLIKSIAYCFVTFFYNKIFLMNLNAKVVFVGASFAGKTSLLNRYMRNQFTLNLPASTQPACFRKSLTINGITVNLEMWDTAGQERYHSLSPLFYRDSQIGVVVFYIKEIFLQK